MLTGWERRLKKLEERLAERDHEQRVESFRKALRQEDERVVKNTLGPARQLSPTQRGAAIRLLSAFDVPTDGMSDAELLAEIGKVLARNATASATPGEVAQARYRRLGHY